MLVSAKSIARDGLFVTRGVPHTGLTRLIGPLAVALIPTSTEGFGHIASSLESPLSPRSSVWNVS